MVSRFRIRATPLAGLKVIERVVMGDERGYLERLYCREELEASGLAEPVAQINHTLTRTRGTVRGLHYQCAPHADTKLVSCLRGEVYDVAVDLRAGSPTLLRWHAETLSAENHVSLLIPAGFAHGFQTLTDDCELVYLHSARYAPQAEGAVSAADPRVGVSWPLPIGGLSARDAAHPFLPADFAGLSP